MNVDNITQKLFLIAAKAIKQQRKEQLAKIRFWNELEKVLKEFQKHSKAQDREWRNKKPMLTHPLPKGQSLPNH